MPDVQDLYRIGTVAKLTGISVERLRAWERRYGLMPAERAGKTRMYSADQVDRLTRIRQLIDQGHPISTLIELSSAQLSERLTPVSSRNSKPVARAASKPRQIGLVGTQLLLLEQANANQPETTDRMGVTARWVSLDAYRSDLAQREHRSALADNDPTSELDLLVILIPSLSPDSLQELSEIPTKKLVIYHFATPDALTLASNLGSPVERWPITWSQLSQLTGQLAGNPLRADYRYPRRFDDEQLLNLAAIGTALGCDCPSELIELISRLNAFSEHSSICRVPSDPHAAAHTKLHMHTSAARAALETALGEWVEVHQASAPLRN